LAEALVAVDEVDAGRGILTLVSETLVDVALAAVAREACRACAAEAPLLQQVASAAIAARPAEASVDLLLAAPPVEAGRACASEATPRRRRARAAVRAREQEARVALKSTKNQINHTSLFFSTLHILFSSQFRHPLQYLMHSRETLVDDFKC
jgi:hypothetical protein